jgi:hypothetical protein
MALKALDKWLWTYLTQSRHDPAAVTDVLLCVCDHFEPFHAAPRDEALRRVNEWRVRFPQLSAPFRDADGQSPAHTFFYPIEQYDEAILEQLADVGRQAHTEVEIHLHHDRDTAAGLRRTLEEGKQRLQRHGFLSRDHTGALRFAFIHGNWALDDSHPSGRHCGVRTELTVLAEAGCYGDFTMPSAPSPTQTRTINSVYYATDTPAPKSHDRGTPMQVGGDASGQGTAGVDADPRAGVASRLLLIQGPLGLNWRWRKFGLLPRLENGELSGANPPTLGRLRLWVELGICIRGRPEWAVVKLHTHGALQRNLEALLGEPMKRFYRALLEADHDGPAPRYHFVTARELVNILHAGEAGQRGNPGLYRDFLYRLER